MACAPVVLVEGMPDGFSPTPADINMALDGYDRRRYKRLRSSLHRNRLVYGRLLLRTSLSRVTGGRIAPEEWRFTRTPLGKPVLAPVRMPFDLSFSLSYSGPLIAVAISKVGSIGMDIELLDSREMPDISSALSNAEQSFIADLPPEKKYPALMRIWTLKESLAKMVGLGFVLDFSLFTILSTSPPLLRSSSSSLLSPEKIRLQSRVVSVRQRRCILSLALHQEKEK
jgi:phosphopantetheinyl transferase